MKSLKKRHTRAQNSGNGRFCQKKASGKLKTENENFGNKAFQSTELRKCSVLQKNCFWEAKNRKMKTLEIRHSRRSKEGNEGIGKKKPLGKQKIKKKKIGKKGVTEQRTREIQRFKEK